jgi:hypothetical protein
MSISVYYWRRPLAPPQPHLDFISSTSSHHSSTTTSTHQSSSYHLSSTSIIYHLHLSSTSIIYIYHLHLSSIIVPSWRATCSSLPSAPQSSAVTRGRYVHHHSLLRFSSDQKTRFVALAPLKLLAQDPASSPLDAARRGLISAPQPLEPRTDLWLCIYKQRVCLPASFFSADSKG